MTKTLTELKELLAYEKHQLATKLQARQKNLGNKVKIEKQIDLHTQRIEELRQELEDEVLLLDDITNDNIN